MATEYDLGSVIGPQGATGLQGISITNVSINAQGNLIITLSNGSNISAGNAKGTKGDKGDKGDIGKSAYQQAKEGGYTGTEAQFIAELNSISGKANANNVYTKSEADAFNAEKANGNEQTGDALNAEKVESAGIATVAKLIPHGTDIVEFAKLQRTGHYRGNGIINTPVSGWAYYDIVCHNASYAKITAAALEDSKKMFVGTIEDNAWKGWKEIPTTESQKLTLLNGWTNYYQDHDHLRMTRIGGLVTVTGIIKAGVSTTNTHIAVLPNTSKVTAIFFANTDATPTTQARFYITDTGVLMASSGVITGADYLINITAQQN